MWYDDLSEDESWTSLWSRYVRCPNCSGIRTLSDPCTVCGINLPNPNERKVALPDGSEVLVADVVLMGGERAYEDYVYLSLLQREWNRMQRDARNVDQSRYAADVSLGAPIVLIFWTYFETRISRLLTDALRAVPSSLSKDLLDRYSSIKARLGSFYKIVFETTYYADLDFLGYPELAGFLSQLMEKRNRFAHGDPLSIADELAEKVVELLKREHEAWIAVYNHRVAGVAKSSVVRS